MSLRMIHLIMSREPPRWPLWVADPVKNMKALVNELPDELRYALISMGCVIVVGLLLTGAFMVVSGSANWAAACCPI